LVAETDAVGRNSDLRIGGPGMSNGGKMVTIALQNGSVSKGKREENNYFSLLPIHYIKIFPNNKFFFLYYSIFLLVIVITHKTGPYLLGEKFL
jgi:hypothetical protein